MIDSSPESPRPKSGQFSRSTVGRAAGMASRLLVSASKLQATAQFLRKQLWVWPIIAAVLFGSAGWWVFHSVENAMRDERSTDLNVMVETSVAALHVWMDDQRDNAQLLADDGELREGIEQLLSLADGSPTADRQLLQSPAQESLRLRLNQRIKQCGYVGFFIVSPESLVLAADIDAPVGKPVDGYRKQICDQAFAGKPTVSKPFPSPLLLENEKGELRANLPTMIAVAPILNEAGKPIAVLSLRIRPQDQFSRILQIVRFGKTGETFAFDKTGLLLSESRFDEQLKQIGLLVDQPDVNSTLTIEIRDPQVNMTKGGRPSLRRPDQPLTKMAAEAVKGHSGNDADGFRDYRGVPVVAAWRWLEDYDFGVATEIEVDEAFHSVYILRRAFWVLMTLLVLSAVAIFLAMLFIARQQRSLQQATLAAKQLGQYSLEEKLGAGGMGTVYRAKHAMLRRPTAVKLLNVEQMSESAIARFEREVQLTSSLTHPNTVSVFDYGRTPDGIFYYAMEYLDGLNLEDLVKRFGPVPESRLIYILKQACGALSEAHTAGMVHRDIKPANIFLTCRGGSHDFVKVLDFGLVKSLEVADQANLTNPNTVTGTPYYLSPEAVNHPDQVDARADVYALAAVGYFILTGTPVFSGSTVVDICMKHMKNTPESPSTRLGKPVSEGLEALILRCLAKAPSDRPKDAAELLQGLESCVIQGKWTAVDATAWWAGHGNIDLPQLSATTLVAKSASPGSTISLDKTMDS